MIDEDMINVATQRFIPAVTAVFAATAGLLLTINIEAGLALFLAAILVLLAFKHPQGVIYFFIMTLPLDGLKLVEGSSAPRLVGFAALIIFLLLVFLRKIKIAWSPIDAAMLAFYLIAGISVLYSTDQEIALTAFMRLSMLFIMYFLISNFSIDEQRIKRVLWFYAIGCTVSILIGFSTGELLGGRFYGRLAGGMSEPNELAQMLTVVFPFIIYASQFHEKRVVKIATYFIGGLFFFAVALSGSRGGVVSFAVMLSLIIYDMVFKQKRRKILLLASAIVVTALYLTPSATLERLSTIPSPHMEKGFSTKYRIANYQAAVSMFLDNPMGVGLRNFEVNNIAYGAHVPHLVVHNTYLEILTGTGFFGLTIYLIIIFLTFQKLWFLFKHSSDKRFATMLTIGYMGLLVAGMFLSSDLEKVTFFLPAIASGISKGRT